MTAPSYRDLLAANIRVARARRRVGQKALAERMRALGFGEWYYQTVGNVESGKRRVTAEEIHALALALVTTIPALMSPDEDEDAVILPSGDVIDAGYVKSLCGKGCNNGTVTWKDGGTVVILRDTQAG